ncbi:unnamed protein product [Lactuca virosa]|uniref:Uncharacterized protein n=1 Tax=Lactuca virosa TaxID=75947 RepID=A0AAU9PWB8_9ASTR|nr:unnamed protein product [Lactuca virosa]
MNKSKANTSYPTVETQIQRYQNSDDQSIDVHHITTIYALKPQQPQCPEAITTGSKSDSTATLKPTPLLCPKATTTGFVGTTTYIDHRQIDPLQEGDQQADQTKWEKDGVERNRCQENLYIIDDRGGRGFQRER